MWAFADQGSYKMAIRKAFKQHDQMKEKALELQEINKTRFSDEVLYKGFVESITDLFDDEDAEEIIVL